MGLTRPNKVRVAIADDHPVVLAGVQALLRMDPELELVGEAADGLAALALVLATLPDVAVVDVSMPGLNGLDLTRRIKLEAPGVKVLALTVHEDRAYIQLLLQGGARGYLLKRSAAEDLVRAVRAVAAGGVYLDPAVADNALTDLTSNVLTNSPVGLSPRECDVLRLIAQGFSNKEIAAQLDISVKTAETYKARATEKLGLRSRAEVVRYGAAQGWLDHLPLAPS
jgi:DNA-binding NarL/FixJ family response regulator